MTAKARLRKAALAALKPVFLIGGAIGWLLLRLLEPWLQVRVGMLAYDRIGELALGTEVFLRHAARHPDPRATTILVAGPPANRQLLKMIARRTRVWTNPWALRFYAHGLRPFVAGTSHELRVTSNGNEYAALAGAGPQLSFTEAEHEEGRRVLRTMGIEPGRPFVCFHARDKAYLDLLHPHCSREQWAYHDYRDCSIANYLPAARGLTDRGLFAVRMGAVAEKPLDQESPLIVDYVTKFRSDFADLYLLAHCKFILGNSSGVCVVPPIFNVPVALANFTPLGYATWSSRDLFIPKLYHDLQGNPLPYRRIIELGGSLWGQGKDFEEAGVRVVENTAAEIAALAEEMNARLDGRWIAQPGDEELQQRYREIFPPEHQITGYPARVGADFLRRHRDLLP